jgi:fluoride exporter
MKDLLLVGSGGFLGSVSRYLVGGWVHRLLGVATFPVGTLAVNVIGCFVIGFLGGLAEARQMLTPEGRLFLMLGFLGGFTTFSSFGYETLSLARGGEGVRALVNVALHLVLGLTAVVAGQQLSRLAG